MRLSGGLVVDLGASAAVVRGKRSIALMRVSKDARSQDHSQRTLGGITHARALMVHVLEAGDTVGDASEADDAAGKQRHKTVGDSNVS